MVTLRTRKGVGRLGIAGGLVALLAGSALFGAPAALAANQNEVVMRLNYDGTTAVAADTAFTDATPTTYAAGDTGAHTPGRDDSLQNRVVRTYDQYGYVIDYDVNEAAGKNLMLTVTLTNGTGGALADPSSPNPNPNSNVRWVQDADMASRGWFTGCLPNPTNDPAGTRIVGVTLYCSLGDLPEGSHGTIRPFASLANGVDTTAIGAKVTLTSSTSTQSPAPSSVPANVFVSAAPLGNWIKNTPTVVPAKSGGTSTGADGYIALFPIGLTDSTKTATPRRGSSAIPAPAAGEVIDFFDHFHNIAGITSTDATDLATKVRPATQAEMDSTHANPVGQRVWGSWCGAYDTQNAGPLPANLPGTWNCSAAVTSPNGYPVKPLSISGYSNTAPATNADGTANRTGYIVTGQLAFWISKGAIEAANGTNTALFDNLITNSGATDNYKNTSTTVKAIEVVPTTHTPNGGAVEYDLTPPNHTDNRTKFTISPPTTGTPGGSGGVTYSSHYGTIVSSYGTQQNVAVDNSGNKWDPSAASIYTSPVLYPLPGQTTSTLWNGKGTVARGQSVSMQMLVGGYTTESKASQLHGCMVWDSEQLKITKMPDMPVRYVHDNISVASAWGTRTPTYPMAQLSVGASNNGAITGGSSQAPRIVEMTQTQMDAYGVKLQFAYDSAVMRNTQAAPAVPNPPAGYDNRAITGNVARNSVECNGTTASGTRTQWVDASSVTYDPADKAYKINGNAVNMARVVMTGTKAFPWYNFSEALAGSSGRLPMGSGIYVSLQAHVGTDLLKNYEGKSLYIHTSRGSGQWNSTTGRPAGTTASPASCNNIPSSTISTNRDAYVAATDTGLPATTSGWCNLAYSTASENLAGTNTTLDVQNFSFYNTNVDAPWDSDTDQITITTVRPDLTKTNVDGDFDIADNGDLVTYRLDVSAVGSNQEALRNVTLTDPLIANYTLVSFTQPTTPGSFCDRRILTGREGLYCRFSSTTDDGPGTETAPPISPRVIRPRSEERSRAACPDRPGMTPSR